MKSLVKKIIVLVMVLLSTTTILSINNASPVYADDLPSKGSCEPKFLGMIPWYCDVNLNPSKTDDLKEQTVKTIISNIFVDIGVLATYLAMAFIVYGGYLYIFASGDPNKIVVARKTLIRAFIGLGITMLANIIINTIRIAALNGANSNGCNLETGAGCLDSTDVFNNVITWFCHISGLVAAIYIIIGGVGYMTSNGDPGKLQKAKTTIIYAIIGLIVVVLSEIIYGFVYNTFVKNSDFESNYTSSITENTTLAIKNNS